MHQDDVRDGEGRLYFYFFNGLSCVRNNDLASGTLRSCQLAPSMELVGIPDTALMLVFKKGAEVAKLSTHNWKIFGYFFHELSDGFLEQVFDVAMQLIFAVCNSARIFP